MNKELIKSYMEALTSKRNELQSMVKSQIGQIAYPQQASELVPEKPKSSAAYPSCIGVGALLLILGLATKSNVVAVGGGLVAAVGIYGMSKGKGARKMESEQIDYAMFTGKLNAQLGEIHALAVNSWDEFSMAQGTELKRAIQTSSLTESEKDKMMDLAIRRSVIQFSMMDVLSALNQIEKEHNIQSYKDYCAQFENQYVGAIEQAYQEQLKRYQAMYDICG